MPSENKATFQGFVAILIWSTNISVIRSLAEKIGILTSTAITFFLAGLIYLLYLGFSSRERFQALFRLPRKYLGVCGALFVVYVCLLYLAIGLAGDRPSTLVVALLNYLWPVFIVVFTIPVLKHRANWMLLPGIIFAAAGIVFAVIGFPGLDGRIFLAHLGSRWPAFLFAFAAAVLWGLYSVYSRRLGRDGASGLPFFLLAAGIILGIIRLFFPETGHFSPAALVETAYLALVSLLAGYAFWDEGIRRGNLVLLATAAYFIPVLSTLFSAAYLSVPLSSGLLWGSVLLVFSAALCNHAVRQ